MIDYFKVLGLNSSASDDEVKTAYRKLSKKFHPDVNDGDKFFEERFKEIKTAYEKLNDPNYRAAFKSFQNNNRTPQEFEQETNNKSTEANPPTPKATASKQESKSKKPFISTGAIITLLTLATLGIGRNLLVDKIQNEKFTEYRNSIKTDVREHHNSSENQKPNQEPQGTLSTRNETISFEKANTSLYEGTIIKLDENYLDNPTCEPTPAVCILIEKELKNGREYHFEKNDSIWVLEDFKSKPQIFQLGNQVVFAPFWDGGNHIGNFIFEFIMLSESERDKTAE